MKACLNWIRTAMRTEMNFNMLRGSGLSRSAYKRRIRSDPPSHGCDILEQFQCLRLAGVGPGRHFDRGFRLLAARA